MHRLYDHLADTTVIPQSTGAPEHSTPFSDLRANPDVRLMRLWFDTKGDDIWLPLNIARGGLTVVNRFEATEHAKTAQNTNLLRQISRSAFTLYQPNKLVDADGNMLAVALPRNSSLQLGRTMNGPFDALRGSGVALNHVLLQVDDEDMLAIESRNIDEPPRIEVLAADSESAVQVGRTGRDYRFNGSIDKEGVTAIDHLKTIEPLGGIIETIPPQFVSLGTLIASADHPVLTTR